MIQVGKIVATHGLSGTLIFTHIVGSSYWLAEGQVLFIALQAGSQIPYFVAKVKPVNNSEYHILLEDIDSPETAKKLIGKSVFAHQEILGSAATDSPLLWVGFSIVDTELGTLGTLTHIVENRQQWIGTLDYNGKEVLLPMVKPIIQEVNIRNRYIRMALPHGLLDL